MKTSSHRPLLSLLALCLFGIGSLVAQNEPVSVTILREDGQRQLGYVQNTNDNGILFSTTPTGQGTPVAHTNLRAVVYNNEGDIMNPARHEYSRSNWEEAQELYQAVADKYDFLFGIKREQLGNFASEARFYQIDCLRRLGRYTEMALAMETDTGRNLENTIAEVYLPTLDLFKLWIALANEDWVTLEGGLTEYEVPLAGSAASFLKSNSFNAESPAVEVQLAFMRAKLMEHKEETEKALRDYYRVMTLGFGGDAILTRSAMEAAMEIQAAEEDLKDSFPKKSEIHALATIYKNVYNSGEISAMMLEHTRPPEMPDALKAQLAAQEEAEAASEEEAPAEEEKPEE